MQPLLEAERGGRWRVVRTAVCPARLRGCKPQVLGVRSAVLVTVRLPFLLLFGDTSPRLGYILRLRTIEVVESAEHRRAELLLTTPAVNGNYSQTESIEALGSCFSLPISSYTSDREPPTHGTCSQRTPLLDAVRT